MANFVLTPVAPGIWRGPAGGSVTVSVRSVNANATKMNSAAYPDGAALIKDANNSATFKIATDGAAHPLDVDILPPAVLDDWSIVEVGLDGTTQTLLDLVAGTPIGEVLIKPKP